MLSAVRQVVNDNLPPGYTEGVGYGMIAWHIPLDSFPNTYNGQPLCYIALAANKSYNTLHLMGPYGDASQRAFLEAEFAKRGKKLDMGKACLHFKRLEDLPLDVIGEIVRRTPAAALMAAHDASHGKKSSTRRKTASRHSSG